MIHGRFKALCVGCAGRDGSYRSSIITWSLYLLALYLSARLMETLVSIYSSQLSCVVTPLYNLLQCKAINRLSEDNPEHSVVQIGVSSIGLSGVLNTSVH